MARKAAAIGTSIALAGFAGLGIAAIGAADRTTPLQPAADTIETQTVAQTQTASVEDRATRPASERRRSPHRNRGRGGARRAQSPAQTANPATTQSRPATTPSDDGPNHDLGDDRGGRGEAEPGDDRGGRGEAEPGDDRGRGGGD